MKQNSLLSELSVIVLTYEKKAWLQKVINYWSAFSIDLNIIDGSEKALNLNMEFLAEKKLKINYFHKPVSYYERLLFASKLNLRKYTLLSCDDETC